MTVKRGSKPKTHLRVDPKALPPEWAVPDHLTGDAAWAWTHLAARLKAAGKLDGADPVIVEAYAVNLALLREARRAIVKDGAILEWGEDRTKAHPACAVVNAASMRLKAILDGFGSVPVDTNGPKQESKWGGVFGSAV